MQVLDGEDLPDAVPRREALEEASTAVDADSEPEPLPARSRLPREDMERPLATFLSEMDNYGAAMRKTLQSLRQTYGESYSVAKQTAKETVKGTSLDPPAITAALPTPPVFGKPSSSKTDTAPA